MFEWLMCLIKLLFECAVNFVVQIYFFCDVLACCNFKNSLGESFVCSCSYH